MSVEEQPWVKEARAEMDGLKEAVVEAIKKELEGHNEIFVTVILAKQQGTVVANSMYSEVPDAGLYTLLFENGIRVANDCGLEVRMEHLFAGAPASPRDLDS